MQDQIFERILDMIHFSKKSEISEGKILNAVVDPEKLEIYLSISFPNILPIKTIAELNKALKEGMVKEKIVNNVVITYSYEKQEIDSISLKEYYHYTVNALKDKKIVYRSLDSFNVDFDTNQVKLSVGKGNDEAIVKPLLDMVQKSLRVLGLDFVDFNIEINPFILPISETIAISKQEDMRAAQSSVSIESAKIAAKDEPKKEKTFKMRNQQKINGKVSRISDIPMTESALIEYNQKNGSSNFVIVGTVSNSSITVTKKGNYKIYQATITDESGSIITKTFINSERNGLDVKFYQEKAHDGDKVRIYGYAQYDNFARDVVLQLLDIISHGPAETKVSKIDDALVKRVELHTHSKMTFLDSVLDIEAYVKRAVEYKHRAIALTDKNSVQGLGEFLHAIEKTKSNILPIYGMEASFVDEDKLKIAFDVEKGKEDINLKNATYVVLDFETTGLSPNYNQIIEIGACKVKNGTIIEEFSSFVNPKRQISTLITNLTSITNDDVRNAPYIEEILPKFKDFCDGCILVAHNAEFDSKHLYHNLKNLGIYDGKYPFFDTLGIARAKYNKKLKKFGLEDLCKLFNVSLEQHHRACDDAKATAQIFIKMLSDFANDNITNYKDINDSIEKEERFRYVHPSHISILAKNRQGLVNLNRIVTDSNTNHFHRGPRTIKSFLDSHRDGLLIGSCCFHGDVFEAALNDSYEDLLQAVSYFDYIEVQPVPAYSYIMREEDVTADDIREIIKKIIKAALELNKIVVATGDVHELDKEDIIYRQMIYSKPLIGGGLHEFSKLKKLPETHYRTTKEMLNEFNFLDEKLAYDIVVTNTNKIADMIERFDLFPQTLFAPGDDFMKDFGVESAKADVRRITLENAKKRYGENLPKIIDERIERELNSIIGHGYGSIYYIAYLLVKHSHDDGYVVGSRGSVGSSLVATFMNITEVNSLPPHYVCPKCHFSAFRYTDEEIKKYNPSQEEMDLQDILQEFNSGPDLPPHKCPHCGAEMQGDGFNIPFETFLGFDGDKVPDIDLNFSGEYQPKAHSFCREIFGVENTFRGGTIGKIAKKTAENYITDFYTKNEKMIRKCEVEVMTPYIEGIKRQTGQHPGGIVVVPKGVDINEVTPVQFPADDITSAWKTTHLDYHKFEANLLKLDILGHDDPTMIRYLMNFVEANPSEFPFTRIEDVPINDTEMLKMFSGVEVLNVTPDQIKSEIGSTGLPEFGTQLTKNMLIEIRPKTVSELIKISGLSHGTDVWAGNARDYFLGINGKSVKVPFDDLIGCRDDIMVRLIQKGVPAKHAFKIMESVRKGRGLSSDHEAIMKQYKIEDWFIDCCKKIKYLFPKAHATAYVIMALRIAWFKLYKPLYYYSGFFSKRVDAFDVMTLAGGYDAILTKVNELSRYGNTKVTNDDDNQDFSTGEESGAKKNEKMLVGLQVALEMVARGYTFKNVHVNKSHATDFIIEGNSLRIPFVAIDSFGASTAKQLVQNRGDVPFTSIKDATRRGHISTSLADKLYQLGAFDGLPKEDEVGLFKFLKDNK